MDKIETYYANGALASVEDKRTLEETKTKKRSKIDTYREVVLNRGIWYMGYLWKSDEASRALITGFVAGISAGIPLPSKFAWQDSDDNEIPFYEENVITLGAYLLEYLNSVYVASRKMKLAVSGLKSLAKLDAFEVEAQAWPDNDIDQSKP